MYAPRNQTHLQRFMETLYVVTIPPASELRMGMQVIWLYISALETKQGCVNSMSLYSAVKTLLDTATATPDAVHGLLPAAAAPIYAAWVEVKNEVPVSALESIIMASPTLSSNLRSQSVKFEEMETSLSVIMYDLLAMAIDNGVNDPVAALVEVGVDIDIVDTMGSTPLLFATDNCNTRPFAPRRRHRDQISNPLYRIPINFSPERISLVHMLLEAKANASQRDMKGTSALHVAASERNLDVLANLLQAKADVDSADHDGITPLIDAILAGEGICAEPLKRRDTRDATSAAPLVRFVTNGMVSTANMLIDFGADVDAEANNGITALTAAVGTQNARLVRVLIDARADVNKPSKDGTANIPNLHMAALQGSLAIVRALLGAKADVHGVDCRGRGPLFYAAQAGHLDVAQALLDAGARAHIDAEDDIGDTALSLAMEHRQTPMVNALVNEGANWRFANQALKSRVISTVIKRNHLNLERLVAAGVDLDITSSSGETPLSQAYKQGDHKAVTVLIAGGASLRMPGGKNLLNVAAKGKDSAMVATIQAALQQRERQKKALESELRDAACCRKPVHHIVALLESKTNVDSVDEHGNTPLYLAARYNNKRAVALLLAAKAKIEVVNAQGQSPLAAAVMNTHGEGDSVEQLLEAKADVNGKDMQGRTPLMIAVYHGRQAVVQQLLAAKAKVNVSDKRGTTALQLAARSGSSRVVQQLLSAKADVKAGVAGKGSKGDTALLLSVRSGSVDCVRMLLDAKASVGTNSRAHQTLLQRAVSEEIRALMQQQGAQRA